MSKIVPNLFIPGAPKAGTSALWSYLGSHPQICFSEPKEPRIFEEAEGDLESRYRQLYAARGPSAAYLGDASTCYLSSPEAIRRIERLVCRPMYIVCLRNPIDLVYALHWEHVLQGLEAEKDFFTAWSDHEHRRRVLQDSPGSVDKRLVVYPDMGLLGAQVERMLESVERCRVFFVLQEDLQARPRQMYLQILDFLGLPDDGRFQFRRVNAASVPRSWLLQRAVQRLVQVKKRFGIPYLGYRINRFYWLINRQEVPRPSLSLKDRSKLKSYFSRDVKKLASILQRNIGQVWTDFGSE